METNEYYNKLVSLMEKPYRKNLDSIGVTEDHHEILFSIVFNQPVKIIIKEDVCYNVYNKYGLSIYYENSDGDWSLKEWSEDGELIQFENPYGKLLK